MHYNTMGGDIPCGDLVKTCHNHEIISHQDVARNDGVMDTSSRDRVGKQMPYGWIKINKPGQDVRNSKDSSSKQEKSHHDPNWRKHSVQ